MTFWIVIAVLYLLNVGFLHWLGGVSSAGEALRRWGRSATAPRHVRGSSD